MAVSVEALLGSGRLERVAPDRSAASLRITKAEQHLATAQMLLGHDNEMAYSALYDAARKAATAHMLAREFAHQPTNRAHTKPSEFIWLRGCRTPVEASGSSSE
jgi:hypothetical protein